MALAQADREVAAQAIEPIPFAVGDGVDHAIDRPAFGQQWREHAPEGAAVARGRDQLAEPEAFCLVEAPLVEQAVEQQRPERVGIGQDPRSGGLPSARSLEDSSHVADPPGERGSEGQLADHVELQPAVAVTVVGDQEPMAAVTLRREPDEARCPGGTQESPEVARDDQDVDVAGPAVELGLATEQAPGQTVLGERPEEGRESRMDLDGIGPRSRRRRLAGRPRGLAADQVGPPGRHHARRYVSPPSGMIGRPGFIDQRPRVSGR